MFCILPKTIRKKICYVLVLFTWSIGFSFIFNYLASFKKPFFKNKVYIDKTYNLPSNKHLQIINRTSNIDFHICILTSERPNNASYLHENLYQLQKQNLNIDFKLENNVSVIDVDDHSSFLNELKEFQDQIIFKAAGRRKLSNCVDDGEDVGDTTINGNLSIPCKVWQLNLDFILGITMCEEHATLLNKKWILWIEDDVFSCENNLQKISEVLKSYASQLCTLLRFSPGLTAFAMSVSCVSSIIPEIESNVNKIPHDNLLKSNPIFKTTYIHNSALFYHVGKISTIKYRNEESFIQLHKDERFNSCENSFE